MRMPMPHADGQGTGTPDTRRIVSPLERRDHTQISDDTRYLVRGEVTCKAVAHAATATGDAARTRLAFTHRFRDRDRHTPEAEDRGLNGVHMRSGVRTGSKHRLL